MGALYIVATPIGNMEDITMRAAKTLLSADVIACEDTRRTGLLLQACQGYVDNYCAAALQLSMVRFDDYTEGKETPQLIEQLLHGKNIVLVSDAGTPLISDPGYRLVSEAIKRGVRVISIPGPTAAIAALTSSGLPANRLLFLGYPPEKQMHRKDLFLALLTIEQCNNYFLLRPAQTAPNARGFKRNNRRHPHSPGSRTHEGT